MKRVFKWLTHESGAEAAGVYVDWFANEFEPRDFDGVERLMVCFTKYCAKLGIVPRREFLAAYLKVDGKRDVKKYGIRTDQMTSYDYKESSQLEEAFRVISEIAVSTYEDYLTESLDNRAFKVDMYNFLASKHAEAIQRAMMQTYPKLSDGSDIVEVSSDLEDSLAHISEVFNVEHVSEIEETRTEPGKIRCIAQTGVPCVDGDIGGIFTGFIYTLTSNPGGGKTRFSLVHWVYPILVNAKEDVLYYELELSKTQAENILIAYHITRVYGGRIKIPDSLALKYDELTDEQKQIWESARIDLFESGKYGTLYLRDKLNIEDMEKDASSVMRQSKGKLSFIGYDYVGMIRSVPTNQYQRRMERYEIIYEAYDIMRRLTHKYDIGVLALNQFNDTGIAKADAGKQMTSGDVQGGHAMNRYSDWDCYLTCTPEHRLAKIRMMSVPKSRFSGGFLNVMFSVDLSVSIFRQEVTK